MLNVYPTPSNTLKILEIYNKPISDFEKKKKTAYILIS